jgi:hypothetical protein
MNDNSQPSANGWATPLDQWKQAALHNVTLAPGCRAVMRFPDLQTLIRNDAIPTHLLQVALKEALAPADEGERLAQQIRDGNLDEPKKLMKELVELQRFITLEAIVEPQISEADLDSGEFPAEAFELARQIAMRERNTDAEGRFLGVVPLDLFTTFRDLHANEEADAGHAPGLDPDCSSCRTLELVFSSAGRVSV